MSGKKRKDLPGWLLIVPCMAIGLLIASCTTQEVAMMPVLNPGATYVGSEACADCHEKELAYHKRSKHASVSIAFSDGIKENDVEGCESCHGAGSLHVESQHKKDIRRESTDACFSCHLNQKAKFKLQHHHPVPEGRMKCSDCHTNLHGRDVRAVANLKRQEDETCFKCHKEVKGPFVFEHDALRDGCTACHNPHGSVQDKLLLAGQTAVCLRCHHDINTNTVAGLGGGVPHGNKAGTTRTGKFDIGRGEECVDHHRAPHGSNIWRTLNR